MVAVRQLSYPGVWVRGVWGCDSKILDLWTRSLMKGIALRKKMDDCAAVTCVV